MTNDTTGIDDKALSSLSVAPNGRESDASDHQGDAGSDADITGELANDPDDTEARLDRGLDESMDASDPPASTQPGRGDGPAPSSGYDPDAEAERAGTD